MVSHDGFVKILDFGLAKLAPLAQRAVRYAQHIRPGRLEPGQILGTLRYMSPEQASGGSRRISGQTSSRSAWCSTKW